MIDILNVAKGQVEAKVQPDCVGYDVGREVVSFISIHWPSLAFPMSLLGDTHGSPTGAATQNEMLLQKACSYPGRNPRKR